MKRVGEGLTYDSSQWASCIFGFFFLSVSSPEIKWKIVQKGPLMMLPKCPLSPSEFCLSFPFRELSRVPTENVEKGLFTSLNFSFSVVPRTSDEKRLKRGHFCMREKQLHTNQYATSLCPILEPLLSLVKPQR